MADLRRALSLYGTKQYAAALPLLHAALRQNEQKPGGPASAGTAEILELLGDCCSSLSNFRTAAEHFRRAAAISGWSFEGRIRASLNAASALFTLNSAEFEKHIIASLDMINAESVAGTTAPALLKGYRATALAYSAANLQNTGCYSEALPPLEENVAYYESTGDTEKLTQCLTGLGYIYLRQGLHEKALAMAHRAQSLDSSSSSVTC